MCPNCGRPMRYARTLEPDQGEVEDVNVYKCSVCNVSYITEDGMQISGPPVH
jgi:rubredoxin